MKIDNELYAYRRHLPSCQLYRRAGRQSRGADQCMCPFHVDGKHYGERVRQSLNTRSRQTADRNLSEIVRKLDERREERARTTGSSTAATERTLKQAIERFLASKGTVQPDGKYRGDVERNTFRKYNSGLTLLLAFCEKRSMRLLDKIEVDALEDFRGSREIGSVMGSTLSRPQQESLLRHFDEVALMFDGDQAGRMATERIVGELAGKVRTMVILIPAESQPDQMTSRQIRWMVNVERATSECRSVLSLEAGLAYRRSRTVQEGFWEAVPLRELAPGPRR